jgi:hypothetical protein
MHALSAATVNAEVGEAKAQSLSYGVLLGATTAISGLLFGFDTAVINGVLLLLRCQFALSNLDTGEKAHVSVERYPGMQQDELGIWNSPGGARVAWFRDPDGNMLSVTQV